MKIIMTHVGMQKTVFVVVVVVVVVVSIAHGTTVHLGVRGGGSSRFNLAPMRFLGKTPGKKHPTPQSPGHAIHKVKYLHRKNVQKYVKRKLINSEELF